MSRATDAGGIGVASRTYRAYGGIRNGSGDLKTDRTYTGQKEDGTGLLYYNARYYDPALGIFLSPDTLVPDASAVIDYNRFLYARGNPLKYNDPSGHETNKPEAWPPFLPWVYDLPDGISYEDFVTWIAENNIPTVIGGQLGISGGGGFGIGGTMATELAWSFNWWSGELAYTWNNSGGLRTGTPEASGGAYVGVTFISGASETVKSVIGPSRNIAADGQIQAIAQVGMAGTWTRAYNYKDTNHNGQFDLYGNSGVSEPLAGPFRDPTFDRTVDGLSLSLSGGVNVLSVSPVDVGLSAAVGDTNRLTIIDVYGPVRRLLNILSDKEN